MKSHPYAELFPLICQDELDLLAEDIKANGLQHPIVVDAQDRVIDGRNRLKACEMAEVEPRFETFHGDDAAVLAKVLSENVRRRQLNETQRGMVAANLATMKQGARTDLASIEATSQPEAAAMLNVSRATVQRCAEVAEKASDLAEKCRAGEMTASKAVKELRKREKAEAKKAVPEDLPEPDGRYVIHHGELAAVGQNVADDSVDWIITDPPYKAEYRDAYEELSEFAARVLKPGGSLICMTGQSFLGAFMELLGRHLNYHWLCAYLTPGGQATQLWQRKVNNFWKPLLWYVNGTYKGDWIGDVCRSDTNDNDKRFHGWGQSESGMADIVERFTFPGQTICDPFCGGGTTGVVALRMNRRFVGIDSDPDAVATTKQRIAEDARA